MRSIVKLLLAGVLVGGCFSATEAFDLSRLIQAGAQAIQAASISNEQVASYVSQYIQQLDAKNDVAGPNDPYTIRLNRITQGLNSVNGIPLNFKVYKTNDVNAFACADGSVRVYAGLMDLMSDDEVLGVIGHEIGHVAHEDTKKQFKQAVLNSAIANGIASSGNWAAVLTDSQLGQLGQYLVQAKYSRKQESEADEYGYEFLKKNGKNPWNMAMAFERLKAVEESSPQASQFVSNLFSDHPEIDKRISNIAKMAKRDGIAKPADYDSAKIPGRIQQTQAGDNSLTPQSQTGSNASRNKSSLGTQKSKNKTTSGKSKTREKTKKTRRR